MIARDNFAELLRRYNEPHRRFHAMGHIRDLLAKMDLYRDLVDPSQLENVRTAIWYHDAIYDPKAKDNEEKSLDLYRDHATAHGNWLGQDSHTICLFIEATKHHLVPTDIVRWREDPNAIIACGFFLSLDLSGFANPFNTQAHIDIRYEYNHVSDADWCNRRIAFLKGLLEQPTIFPDPILETMWREKAVENIRRELYAVINARESLKFDSEPYWYQYVQHANQATEEILHHDKWLDLSWIKIEG